MTLTNSQLNAVDLAERVAGSLSLLGCAFILTTYSISASFRKPVNRLIFYAAFGNIFAAVSSLIGRDGLLQGPDSALCQVQAFFIQCWMPADSLWSFCMALNVYLTFYKKATSVNLQRLEKWYFLACYGLPIVFSTALSVIKTQERGRVYGPALIWCSITEQWQFLRLVCFYGPVWVIMLVTLAIYIRVGMDILNNHKRLLATSDLEPVNSPIKATQVVTVNITRNTAETNANRTASTLAHVEHYARTEISAERKSKSIMWSYLRYSFLFFIAMVVTWLPSSINRIYSIAKPSEDGFGLNLAGALVLSLQGFWNSIIYASVSYPRLKRVWASRAKSECGSTLPWKTIAKDRRTSIPLVEISFDGRSNAGSTASLARN